MKRSDQVLNTLSLVRELVRTEIVAAILEAEHYKNNNKHPVNLLSKVSELKAHAGNIMHRLATRIEESNDG